MTEHILLYGLSPSNFNKSLKFPSKTCRNSPVNSMEKFTLQQKSSKSKKLVLISLKNKTLGEKFIKYVYYIHLEENCKIKNLYDLKIFHDLKIQKLFHQSSIIIQRIVKGWLIRKKYEEILIEVRRRVTNKLISEMDTEIQEKFYLGNRIHFAIIKIQSVYKG